MGRIGIFGGSFNPPHKGHLLAVQEQRRVLRLDKVLLIPAGMPPHKQLAQDSPSGGMRLAMTKALVAGDSALAVSDIELNRKGNSYTADTLLSLHAQYPDDELFLLMGTDMFLSFHTWSRPEVICRLASICLALRQTPSKKEMQFIYAQSDFLRCNYGARVLQIQNDYVEMSSTTVRRMLRFDCAEAYLTSGVLKLIYDNLLSYLKTKGVEKIEAMGGEFNTDEHEAIAQMPVQEEEKKNHIIDVTRQGYKLKDKVIRYAQVVVGI